MRHRDADGGDLQVSVGHAMVDFFDGIVISEIFHDALVDRRVHLNTIQQSLPVLDHVLLSDGTCPLLASKCTNTATTSGARLLAGAPAESESKGPILCRTPIVLHGDGQHVQLKSNLYRAELHRSSFRTSRTGTLGFPFQADCPRHFSNHTPVARVQIITDLANLLVFETKIFNSGAAKPETQSQDLYRGILAAAGLLTKSDRLSVFIAHRDCIICDRAARKLFFSI